MEVDSELDDYEELSFSANGSTFATSFHALATVTSSLYPVSDLSYKTGYFRTSSHKSSFSLKFKNTLEVIFRYTPSIYYTKVIKREKKRKKYEKNML